MATCEEHSVLVSRLNEIEKASKQNSIEVAELKGVISLWGKLVIAGVPVVMKLVEFLFSHANAAIN